MVKHLTYILVLLCMQATAALAQQTAVSGRVTDAATGEAMPYVNVVFKGTTIGASTNFDGYYSITIATKVDSVMASFMGYDIIVKPIKQGISQVVDFQLEETISEVSEVVVTPGENPANKIIRKVDERRDFNEFKSLEAYQYESFTKIQLAVDNLSEKFKNKKMAQPILPLFDTVAHLSEGGKPILPVFISESLSDFYVLMKPYHTREYIKATKVVGVGVTDGSLTSQIIGSSFQQYNFYNNWVNILDKNFVSPIAGSALMYYVFTIRDTVEIDGKPCYELQVNPKREGDLAFTGKIWIQDSTYALKRAMLEISSKANLNFIDKLKIQQELEMTSAGPWLPSKTRVLINIQELSENTPGMVALFYTSNKDFVVNQPKPVKFYENRLEVAEDATQFDDEFWNENRHEQISESEKRVYKMVDTLRNLPAVKTWIEYVDIAINGFKDFGKVEIGPYALFYGYNNLEGNRFRVGFKTNEYFSKKWTIRGYGAYGTLDGRFKYSGQVERILSRRRWTIVGLKYKNDVEQIGVSDQDYSTSNLFTQLSLFQADQLNRTVEYKTWASRELKKGITAKISVQNKSYSFTPIRNFNFAYYQNPEDPANSSISTDFINSSVTLEARIAMKELFIIDGNDRVSIGNANAPRFKFSYTRGFKDVLGSGFNYNKAEVEIRQYIVFGTLGQGDYIFSAGKVFDPLPYPLLFVQRGNEAIVSSRSAYNLMNFFEFVTDQYVAMNYEHHFEGLLTNRLPLVKKWKLRLFATGKGVWGSVTPQNLAMLPKVDMNGRPVSSFGEINREPYIEVGYGLENIFRVLRVDFVHRLTHLNNPAARPFGVKFQVQLSF